MPFQSISICLAIVRPGKRSNLTTNGCVSFLGLKSDLHCFGNIMCYIVILPFFVGNFCQLSGLFCQFIGVCLVNEASFGRDLQVFY